MKTLKVPLTALEMKLLLAGLDAIGWDVLPEWHEDRRAAQLVKRKLNDARTALIVKEGQR